MALVAVGLLGIITIFRTSMGGIFQTVSDTLNNAESTDFRVS